MSEENETFGDVMRNTPPFLVFGNGIRIIKDKDGWLVAKDFGNDGNPDLGMLSWFGNQEGVWQTFIDALRSAVEHS